MYKYIAQTVFGVLVAAATVFAGPGMPMPADACNPTGGMTAATSSITINIDSTTQNSIYSDVTGRVGSDMDCPYTVRIYASTTSVVSTTQYQATELLGTVQSVGPFAYNNRVISGLASGTQYYLLACIIGDDPGQQICSNDITATTTATTSTNNNGSGGGIFQQQPVVGIVYATNTGTSSIDVSATIQSVGCAASVWFEAEHNGAIQTSSAQSSVGATLSTTATASLNGLQPGTQYRIRAAARNCIGGTVYGPYSQFTTNGSAYSTPIINSNNFNQNTGNTHMSYSSSSFYNQRYNSYATNSTSHSREGYWDIDPTEGQVIDENYYYNNVHQYNSSNTSYNAGSAILNTVAYQSGQQPYPHSYYRGNGGDLRVWDRPFDIVALSQGIRGGVAKTYTNYYWGGPSSLFIGLLIVIILMGVGLYRLGRSTPVRA